MYRSLLEYHFQLQVLIFFKLHGRKFQIFNYMTYKYSLNRWKRKKIFGPIISVQMHFVELPSPLENENRNNKYESKFLKFGGGTEKFTAA